MIFVESIFGHFSLKFRKKQQIFLFYCLLFTGYSILAHLVASTITPDNYWRTTAGGSLFPIPFPSFGVLQAVSPLNIIDSLILNLFIRTGILAILTLVFWLLFIQYIRKYKSQILISKVESK